MNSVEKWRKQILLPGLTEPDIDDLDQDDKPDFSNDDGEPVIGISRHRIGIDGSGVTTLVAFHGCELRAVRQ